MRHAEALNRRAHDLADLDRPHRTCVRQQQAEFLAAITARKAHGVGGDTGQGFAEPAEAGVAFRMAIGVVVRFEVIDIDHQQRQLAVLLLRLHPFEIQAALEAAPVGETDSMSMEAITVSRSLLASSSRSRWPSRAAIVLKARASGMNSDGRRLRATRADELPSP